MGSAQHSCPIHRVHNVSLLYGLQGEEEGGTQPPRHRGGRSERGSRVNVSGQTNFQFIIQNGCVCWSLGSFLRKISRILQLFSHQPLSRGIMRSYGVIVAITVCFVLALPHSAEGILKRCVRCRSRGDLGSCKDPFTMNSTQIDDEIGVHAALCQSGWCVKIIESQNLNNEYGTATERLCLQRGPDDNEERCAYTKWNNQKVYMCFCNGDLCNSATTIPISSVLYLTAFLLCTLTQWF